MLIFENHCFDSTFLVILQRHGDSCLGAKAVFICPGDNKADRLGFLGIEESNCFFGRQSDIGGSGFDDLFDYLCENLRSDWICRSWFWLCDAVSETSNYRHKIFGFESDVFNEWGP
jgi:hypothetical protein